jgi:hypothetical protein
MSLKKQKAKFDLIVELPNWFKYKETSIFFTRFIASVLFTNHRSDDIDNQNYLLPG